MAQVIKADALCIGNELGDRQKLPAAEVSALVAKLQLLAPGAEKESVWLTLLRELFPWALRVVKWYSRRVPRLDAAEQQQLAAVGVFMAVNTYTPKCGGVTNWIHITVRKMVQRDVLRQQDRMSRVPLAAALDSIVGNRKEKAELGPALKLQLYALLQLQCGKRDAEIIMEYMRGIPVTELAQKYRVSRTRLYQVITKCLQDLRVPLAPVWEAYCAGSDRIQLGSCA